MATKPKPRAVSIKASRLVTRPDSRTLTRAGQGNGEAIADDGHGSLFDKLKRKYPHIDHKALEEHLAKPLEPQPLWLASGRSVSMNREERGDVIIAHFQMCGMTFKQAASTKPLQRIFLRAIEENKDYGSDGV